MEQHPFNQSSWGRAKQDTISAQKTARFMWGGEGVLAVAGGTWLVQIAPLGASTSEIVGRSVIGGLGGLLTAILIIFAWNLLRAPYKQRDEARQKVISTEKELNGRLSELQNSLDKIKDTLPNIELVGTENIKTAIRDVRTGKILGEPVFTQVKFANNPATLLQAVDATNVVGHIDIYSQDGKHIFNMIGRWSETREEALGAQPTEMEQIVIPANGRPNPMDLVLKYPWDRDCYGHTNKGRRLAPNDWRDEQKRLPIGSYLVKVHLRGSNVDKEFWLQFVNKGEENDIELEVLTIVPSILDMRGSQP